MVKFKFYLVLFVSVSVMFYGCGLCCSNPKDIYEIVQNYYGEQLSTTAHLKTKACTTSQGADKSILNAIDK